MPLLELPALAVVGGAIGILRRQACRDIGRQIFDDRAAAADAFGKVPCANALGTPNLPRPPPARRRKLAGCPKTSGNGQLVLDAGGEGWIFSGSWDKQG